MIPDDPLRPAVCTCLSISRDPLCFFHGDVEKVAALCAVPHEEKDRDQSRPLNPSGTSSSDQAATITEAKEAIVTMLVSHGVIGARQGVEELITAAFTAGVNECARRYEDLRARPDASPYDLSTGDKGVKAIKKAGLT